MTNATKTAEQAMRDYGYTEVNGMFVRGSTQAWQRAEEGGWHRFDPPTTLVSAPFSAEGAADPSGGQPWGVIVPEVGWLQVPYRLTERFRNVGGLHPATHPECFEWVWPEEQVAEMYEFASKPGEDNPFVRIDDILVHKDDIEG